MVKVKFEVNKKKAIFLALFVGILIGAFGVIAYGTNNPSVFGHDIGELDGVVGSAIFLQNPWNVHNGNTDSPLSQFNLASIVDVYAPAGDVKEILISAHLETPPVMNAEVKIKYYLPLAPPIAEKTILDARSFGPDKEAETTLVWLPVKNNAFSYSCEMFGNDPSQNCKIDILGYRY